MSDPSPRQEPAAATPLPVGDPTKPAVSPPPPAPLTPEEQMALFAQELKETDWGHQPC